MGIPITIKPNKPDGRFVKAQGTQVLIGETKVPGVVSIDVHYRVDDIVTADIHLHSYMDRADGVNGAFYIKHPVTNKYEPVEKIVFQNGDEVRLDGIKDVTDLDSWCREFRPTC